MGSSAEDLGRVGRDTAGRSRGRHGAGGGGGRGFMSRVRPLLRDLSGGSSVQITARLAGQVAAAVEGARLARSAVRMEIPSEQARDLISVVEHQGDDERSQLVALLAESLVTPIDREDLFRLSRSIDDVLDNLRDFVREHDLHGADCHLIFPAMLDAIEVALENLGEAVEHLDDDPALASPGALAAKKEGNLIRQLYQHGVAEVLDETVVTPDMLKRRELLRRLDVVGLRLGEAADALADGAVKRSH